MREAAAMLHNDASHLKIMADRLADEEVPSEAEILAARKALHGGA